MFAFGSHHHFPGHSMPSLWSLSALLYENMPFDPHIFYWGIIPQTFSIGLRYGVIGVQLITSKLEYFPEQLGAIYKHDPAKR